MRIALIQCGHVHPELVADHGDYPELFADLLDHHGIDLTTFDVTEHPPPTDIERFDGWLISGSTSSAYEDLPWIAPVEALARDLVDRQAPLVAVCFGHQLLAQALGGRVERADGGWGVGAHRYEVLGEPPAWMDPPASSVRLIASHQDQVAELPSGATVIARSDHCPVAAYTVGPAALAIQPHPEFTAPVSRGLIVRRREAIGSERAEDALESLDGPLDRDLVARWMAGFWRMAAGR
jgi:GMP synthase-like glutamine amidotransferase